MMLVIEGVLSPEEAAAQHTLAAGLAWDDGRKTAGRFVREVKANDQAAPSPARDAILDRVRAAILAHPATARPR